MVQRASMCGDQRLQSLRNASIHIGGTVEPVGVRPAKWRYGGPHTVVAAVRQFLRTYWLLVRASKQIVWTSSRPVAQRRRKNRPRSTRRLPGLQPINWIGQQINAHYGRAADLCTRRPHLAITSALTMQRCHRRYNGNTFASWISKRTA